MTPANPMQPLVRPDDGVVRFKENAIVSFLLDRGGIDLNDLARLPFSQDDRCQFAQLIGYSLSGYGELSYVSDEHAAAASAEAKKQWPEVGTCRDTGCEMHSGVERE